jgi:4'-phosphopantetheinyl transferase
MDMVTPQTGWAAAPWFPEVAGDEVHVWRFSIEPPPGRLLELERSLSADELERAARYHFEQGRAHFVAARGSLRAILARYLQVDADCLGFRYSAYGKPELSGAYAGSEIRFSLSHSGQMGLLAVGRGRSLGVDIERIRMEVDDAGIARRFFSPAEVAGLSALPDSMRKQAFFNCWTRKEACIKAWGEGLSRPLDQFDVSVAPNEPARLTGTRPDPGEAAHWSLRHLDPGPGYAAALAVRGVLGKLICWSI